MKFIFDYTETLEKNPEANERVVSSIKNTLSKYMEAVCTRVKKAVSLLFVDYQIKWKLGKNPKSKSQRRKEMRRRSKS